jgi:hypothetical protein
MVLFLFPSDEPSHRRIGTPITLRRVHKTAGILIYFSILERTALNKSKERNPNTLLNGAVPAEQNEEEDSVCKAYTSKSRREVTRDDNFDLILDQKRFIPRTCQRKSR